MIKNSLSKSSMKIPEKLKILRTYDDMKKSQNEDLERTVTSISQKLYIGEAEKIRKRAARKNKKVNR